MKSQFILGLLASALLASCSGIGGSKVEINTELDSVCYLLGHTNGSGMVESKDDFPGGGVNLVEFVDGFMDGIDSLDSKLEVENEEVFLQAYFTEAQSAGQKQAQEMAMDSTLDLPKYVHTAVDTASYLYGHMIGGQYFNGRTDFPGGPMNIPAIKDGFKDGTSSADAKLVVDDVKTYLNNYFQKAQQAAAAEQAAAAAQEAGPKLEEVAKFMEENGKRPGVVTDASGKIQYEVMKKGNGPKPVASDNVTVHYHGTLLDGTVFDSSVDRGEPATFGLNQVIRGWTEGVQLMPTGSKYKFFIHPDYAYGAQGRPGIPGSSLLVFEVELLSIAK